MYRYKAMVVKFTALVLWLSILFKSSTNYSQMKIIRKLKWLWDYLNWVTTCFAPSHFLRKNIINKILLSV